MISWKIKKFSRSRYSTHISDRSIYPNEDRCFERVEVVDGKPHLFAGVIDGAAPLVTPDLPTNSTTPGELVAETIRKTFMKIDPKTSLSDMLVEANRCVREVSKAYEVDLSRPEALWAAAVSIVKISATKKTIEYAHIADTLILVVCKEQEILLTEDQVDPFDRQVLMKIRDLCCTGNFDRQIQAKEVKPLLIAQKALANSPNGNGYGAINGMPDDQVRRYVQTGEIRITPDIEFVVLMTDGLLPPLQGLNQKTNWGQIAQILRMEGLEGLFKCTREIELSDPKLNYPRVKMHDDATGILIPIKHRVID